MMIIFDPQELEAIIQAVSSADNTDAIPAHSWARAAKILLARNAQLTRLLERGYIILHDSDREPIEIIKEIDSLLEGKEVE